MKKMLSLVFACLLITGTFTSCGKTDTPSGNENSKNNSVEVSENSSEENDSKEEESSSKASEEKADDKSGSTPSRGITDENTYKNDYAKLNFTFPEGWVAATDEEIANIMQITMDSLDLPGGKITEKMLDMKVIYDGILQNQVTGSNIIIMFENIGLSLGGSNITMETYIEALKTQMGNMNPGTSFEFTEQPEQILGGEKYTVIKVDANSMSQNYYLRKDGKYIICVVITADPSESVEDIVSNFS